MIQDIVIFAAATPNGIKVPIALEELGIDYEIERVALGSPFLQSPSFRALNPNGKIPALRHRLPSGEIVTLFESGAILLHLAQHYGALLGTAAQARADTLSWLFLQIAGLGPMMGQAGHFLSMRSPDPYALGRFEGEARRHFALLQERLATHEWLNGESYSIADIAHFSWARQAAYAGLQLGDHPAIARWVDAIEHRAATRAALSRLS